MFQDLSITFSQLVSNFENNEYELTQVPQEFIDRYGYACLANSLIFKEPKIPKYNAKIADYIKKTKFKTLKSLISYIKQLPNDIDKLFAIFSYTSINIEYDSELCFSNKSKPTTLERVFETKKAVCSGYSLFYKEMSKKVGIDKKRITVNEYLNFSKAHSFDPFEEPKTIESNHASIYVTIDGVPFISEPTWASGQLTENKKFEKNFRPNLFLIPLFKSLCDHYPCEESRELLQLNFPFSHFFQSIKIDPFGREIKTESNPFVNITSSNGYVEQTYSCLGPIDSIEFNLYLQKNNVFSEISTDGLTSYEIIQTSLPKHPDRCRFKTYILLPEVGLYKVDMFIDSKATLTYYIDNLKKASGSIPVKYNPFQKYQFIPIKPKNVHSEAEKVSIIRFAASKSHSNIRWKIFKHQSNDNFDEKGEYIDQSYGKYMKLEIPFDNEHYEIQLCVGFPSNGRYSILVYLENEKGSYAFFTKYFIHAVGVESGKTYKTHPAYYMFKGRKFAPIKYFDDDKEVIVKPNKSCYIVSEREQTIQIKTTDVNDKLYFELRNEGETLSWPKVMDSNGQFKQINFELPDEYGEYCLKGWINDSCCINLFYMYGIIQFKDETEEEQKLMNDLKNQINLSGKTNEEKSTDGLEKDNKTADKTKEYDDSKINSEKNQQDEIERLLKIIEELKLENEKSKNLCDEKSKEIEKLNLENNDLKNNNEDLKREIEEIKEDNEKKILNNKKIEQLQIEITEMVIDIENINMDYNEQLDSEKDVTKKQSDYQKLEKINNEMKIENEKLKQENESLRKEIEILALKIDSFETKDDDEKKKTNDEKANKIIDQLKKENQRIKIEFKSSFAEIEKLKKANEKIISENKGKSEMINKEKRRADLSNTLNTKLKKENERLKAENKASVHQKEEQLKIIEESNNENSKLKECNELLSTENDKFKNEIEILKNEIEKINQEGRFEAKCEDDLNIEYDAKPKQKNTKSITIDKISHQNNISNNTPKSKSRTSSVINTVPRTISKQINDIKRASTPNKRSNEMNQKTSKIKDHQKMSQTVKIKESINIFDSENSSFSKISTSKSEDQIKKSRKSRAATPDPRSENTKLKLKISNSSTCNQMLLSDDILSNKVISSSEDEMAQLKKLKTNSKALTNNFSKTLTPKTKDLISTTLKSKDKSVNFRKMSVETPDNNTQNSEVFNEKIAKSESEEDKNLIEKDESKTSESNNTKQKSVLVNENKCLLTSDSLEIHSDDENPKSFNCKPNTKSKKFSYTLTPRSKVDKSNLHTSMIPIPDENNNQKSNKSESLKNKADRPKPRLTNTSIKISEDGNSHETPAKSKTSRKSRPSPRIINSSHKTENINPNTTNDKKPKVENVRPAFWNY